MNKKSKEITTEEIKKIIMKSGYLLEIDVADMLRKDGWLVFSQHPYRDQKENKTRLVDILAMKHVRKKVGVSLLIECKKATRHGWAFSTIGKSEVEAQPVFARVEYFLAKVREIVDLSSGRVDMKGFHSADIFTKIGTSCCIPPGQKDDFHEGLLQLLNSMRCLRNRMAILVNFPVIVFDGPMWEFYKEEGKLKVEEIEYLQYISAMFNEEMEGPVLIDVVKSSFFPDFLKLVNGSIRWLKEASK